MLQRVSFRYSAAGLAPLGIAAWLLMGAAAPSRDEQLAQARNLGKAFYENPTTSKEAVAEFEKALKLAPDSNREKLNFALALLRAGQANRAVPLLEEVEKRDPKLPHPWFNLGIYYKKSGDAEHAIAQFERMQSLTPAEPIVHYQLGALYKQVGRMNDALAQFEQAEKLDPLLAAARFQLYNAYRAAGRKDDAARELAEFQRLKAAQQNAAVPEDVDWCTYAEIYDPPAPQPQPPAVEPRFESRVLDRAFDAPIAGLALIDADASGHTDLLAWSVKGAALYRRGSDLAKDSGLAGITGVIHIAPGDFDNDGKMDLAIVTESGPILMRNTGGRFERVDAALPQRRFDRAVWIDYDHDYDLDLLLFGEQPALLRNQGAAGFADRTADFPFAPGVVADAYKTRIDPDSKAFDLVAGSTLYRDDLGGHYHAEPFQGRARDLSQIEADFDGDGKPDRVRITSDGQLEFLHNVSPGGPHWISVQLTGVKSLKLAQDAEVEIKAGTLYRKQRYEGVPLLFDAGGVAAIDVVRITWPNGLIQNETRQAADKRYKYEEAQRLSGSCPMIWTWNGREFQFITDVLGVAPLGASDGDGTYFPVDHDEYVSIPGSALTARDGFYDVRITEELSEVSYLDQVELLAVDHPARTEIFTNEKFKGPPYPEFRLYGVDRRIYPRAARDSAGRDVLPRLLARDARYPDQFSRNGNGIAEMHSLDLDFTGAAPGGHAVLLLNGWVDWPDGSTFRAASQESKEGLVTPYLQAQNDKGEFQTINSDMGMPAGKPKTIAVDVRFPSASRKLRIVTNLCVYWDEVFLSERAAAPRERHTAVPLVSASLGFRGFSESRIDPARKQPDTYFYGRVSPVSFWNPTPGLYTRYGDVLDLATRIDDRPIIMGSGDELRLRFSSALPALPSGWTRDFLLKVDGWAKDRDPNTAFSTTVEPLPFHAMSVYPYPPTEHFPTDEAHQLYRRQYNTRPALHLLPDLTCGARTSACSAGTHSGASRGTN